MIYSKTAKVYINGFNMKRYKALGYNVSYGEYADIRVEDLSDSSTVNVLFKCDYCGRVFEREWGIYIRDKKKCPVQRDACKECFPKKLEESMVLRYGVKNSMNLESTKEKVKNTNIERYGVENARQNENVKEKFKNTCLERYGTTSPLKNEQIKQRFINTNIERYGGKSPLCDESVRRKSLETMQNNIGPNKYMMSAQQKHFWDIYNGCVNTPVGKYCADILFEEEKIDFEYSGGGHDLKVKLGCITKEEFTKKEEDRRLYFLNRGYKEFEIISSNDVLPDDEFLIQLKGKAFNILLNSNTVYYGYNLNTGEEIYK